MWEGNIADMLSLHPPPSFSWEETTNLDILLDMVDSVKLFLKFLKIGLGTVIDP